jgi:hypothetical protein
MWLINLLYGAGSILKCFGTHDFKSKTVFLIDPNGPERFTGFPPGSGGEAFAGVPGNDFVNRGRYDTYGCCSRCGLRSDGKGFDY